MQSDCQPDNAIIHPNNSLNRANIAAMEYLHYSKKVSDILGFQV